MIEAGSQGEKRCSEGLIHITAHQGEVLKTRKRLKNLVDALSDLFSLRFSEEELDEAGHLFGTFHPGTYRGPEFFEKHAHEPLGGRCGLQSLPCAVEIPCEVASLLLGNPLAKGLENGVLCLCS